MVSSGALSVRISSVMQASIYLFLQLKDIFFYQKQASESMMKVSFKTFTIYLPLPGQFS